MLLPGQPQLGRASPLLLHTSMQLGNAAPQMPAAEAAGIIWCGGFYSHSLKSVTSATAFGQMQCLATLFAGKHSKQARHLLEVVCF